jgi:hypothetical protein
MSGPAGLGKIRAAQSEAGGTETEEYFENADCEEYI